MENQIRSGNYLKAPSSFAQQKVPQIHRYAPAPKLSLTYRKSIRLIRLRTCRRSLLVEEGLEREMEWGLGWGLAVCKSRRSHRSSR